jgi:hypothetical protein
MKDKDCSVEVATAYRPTANSNWQTTELSTALVYFKTSQTVKIYKLKKAREVYIVNNKHVSSDPSGSAI